MLRLDNLILNTTYFDLLSSFRVVLNSKGIKYLREIKNGQDNIQVTCPYHKGGNEKKASAGISVKDGTFHCFTCGTVRTFTQVLSYCLGYSDNGEKGKEWIINNTETSEMNTRLLESNLNRGVNQMKFVSEQELDSYRYYHPYMYQRKLTNAIIEKFDIGYDKNFVIEKKDDKGNIVQYPVGECITFPVRDKQGRCLFVARRAIHQKVFHYPSGAEKPLYGIYELSKSCKSLIICESMLNCLTCYVYGKEAIALNGTGSDSQIQEIGKLNVRVIYLGLDNDEAGDKGSCRIFEALKNRFLFYRLKCPEGKDINDLSAEEFSYAYDTAIRIV